MTDICAGDWVTLTTDASDRQVALLEGPTSTEVTGRLPVDIQVLVLAIASGGEAPYLVGGFDADDEFHHGWVPGVNLYKRQPTGYGAILEQNFSTEELQALSQALDARRSAASTGRPGVLTAAQSAALAKWDRLSGGEASSSLPLMNLSV